MQHKNNINSSLLAITEQCKCISDSLKQKTDLELVDLAQSCSAQSASAKTLLISRYLPKILRESKKIFHGQTRDFWDMDDNCWEILTNPEGGYCWLFEHGDQRGKGHLDKKFKRPGVKQ